MIFPTLTLETTLQIEDKTRLDASLSFTSNDGNITSVEIKPEATESFIEVYNIDEDKWYLDWAYETDGIKTVEIKVTTDTAATRTRSYSVTVLTVAEDALFSSDADIYPYEPDLIKSLPVGKSTYLYAHRAAQTKIIAYLDEQRIWKEDNSRFSKEDLTDLEEFKRWSIFQTLLIIVMKQLN